MDNPIKAIRLSLKLSQGDLIRFSGLSRLVVLRTEQGLYSSPSRQITTPLIDLTGGAITHEQIRDLYHAYQKYQRGSQAYWIANVVALGNGIKVTSTLPAVADPLSTLHPFIYLRKRYAPVEFQSRLGFCRAFCLHPNSIRLFESGEQLTLPSSLVVGLTEAKMPRSVLDTYEHSVLVWARARESRTNG